jgi:hypothetical protein
MSTLSTIQGIDRATREAVAQYWTIRRSQQDRQKLAGRTDQGARSAVTGGAQMDGFVQLFARIITEMGIDTRCVFFKKALELPGFFRPTKEWDLLAVRDGQLVVALEAKSQVGPSFSNNFNNRTEEALGSALDLWTAFREGAFDGGVQPFLGYFFMLEDHPASRAPVRVREPHFRVFPEFAGSSYAKRYEFFCRKLVRERHYTAAGFITSRRDTGLQGDYDEPASDLSVSAFARALAAHVSAYASIRN